MLHTSSQIHQYLSSAGEDYGAVNAKLSFPAGSNSGVNICTNISVIDDLAFEREEDFLICVTSELGVTIDESYALVKITDNDGKCIQLWLYNIMLFQDHLSRYY